MGKHKFIARRKRNYYLCKLIFNDSKNKLKIKYAPVCQDAKDI